MKTDVPILSVRQPWAWLLVAGHKDIENRERRFSYRGRLCIHASLSKKELATDSLWVGEAFQITVPSRLYFGAVIGSVEVVDCVREHKSRWFEGPNGLVCANAKLYDEPIPARGRLWLFRLPELAEIIAAAEGRTGTREITIEKHSRFIL